MENRSQIKSSLITSFIDNVDLFLDKLEDEGLSDQERYLDFGNIVLKNGKDFVICFSAFEEPNIIEELLDYYNPN